MTAKTTKQPAKKAPSVRLMPAVMVTVAAVLGLKAVAMAESVAETVAAAGHEEPTAAAGGHGEETAAATTTQQCEAPTLADMAGLSQAEVQVLQALGTRRAELDARGVAMETQDGLMLAAEQRISERLAELRTLETHVNDLLGQLDQAQEQRLRELVGVYERMRARDAAAVFDGLEDDVLVQVASRMRQANLAEVMGQMDPVRARALTQMLADRARPPTSGGNLLERARGDAPATAP
jgi:flagellar motility protein MotE (MotC chaperone)